MEKAKGAEIPREIIRARRKGARRHGVHCIHRRAVALGALVVVVGHLRHVAGRSRGRMERGDPSACPTLNSVKAVAFHAPIADRNATLPRLGSRVRIPSPAPCLSAISMAYGTITPGGPFCPNPWKQGGSKCSEREDPDGRRARGMSEDDDDAGGCLQTELSLVRTSPSEPATHTGDASRSLGKSDMYPAMPAGAKGLHHFAEWHSGGQGFDSPWLHQQYQKLTAPRFLW